MAKRTIKNKKASTKYTKYTVSGDKVESKATCPKCGPGIFLAEHKNRKTCGSCGYTIFQGKEAPKKEAPKEEKPKKDKPKEAPKAEEKPKEEKKE